MIEANRHQDRHKPLDMADIDAFGPEAARHVMSFLRACPRHAETPLVSLPGQARALGVASIQLKDEAGRLGLGSFKALGGAYAVIRLVTEAAERALGRRLAPEQVLDPAVKSVARGFTVGCATDGNHGRSVAAGARLVGCRAVIFVHHGVDPERIAAIAAFGAEIVQVRGSYDDAVAEAARQCLTNGWTIVSDTSWPGYERVPALVMQGYTAMVAEVIAATTEPPTHVFLQAGVGGFAAAISAHLTIVLGPRRPRIIVVEPERAACLFESHRAGVLTRIEEGQPTVMAMLECYEPSLVAWRVLSRLADVFMTVTDQQGIEAMRRLARPQAGDPAIVAGESGAAGLAGLLDAAATDRARGLVGLDASARVLLVNTEGATAPQTYERLIGAA